MHSSRHGIRGICKASKKVMDRFFLLINEFALLWMASDDNAHGQGSMAPSMSIHVFGQLAPG